MGLISGTNERIKELLKILNSFENDFKNQTDSDGQKDLKEALKGKNNLGQWGYFLDNALSLLANQNLANLENQDLKANPKLSYSASSSDVNGKIDERFEQGGTGDCWLIAGILSLNTTDEGKKILENSLTVNFNGSVTVTFKGAGVSYVVSKSEIAKYDTDSNLYDSYSNGDNDVLALELATEKLFKDIRNGNVTLKDGEINLLIKESTDIGDGGLTDTLFYLLTGKNSKVYISGNTVSTLKNGFSESKINSILTEASKSEPIAMNFGVSFGTHSAKCTNGKTFTLDLGEGGHALAVTNINSAQKTITFVNPFDTQKSYTMSWSEFAKLGVGQIGYIKLEKETQEDTPVVSQEPEPSVSPEPSEVDTPCPSLPEIIRPEEPSLIPTPSIAPEPSIIPAPSVAPEPTEIAVSVEPSIIPAPSVAPEPTEIAVSVEPSVAPEPEIDEDTDIDIQSTDIQTVMDSLKVSQAEQDLINDLIKSEKINIKETLPDGSPRYIFAKGAKDNTFHCYDMSTGYKEDSATTSYKTSEKIGNGTSLARIYGSVSSKSSLKGLDIISNGNGKIYDASKRKKIEPSKIYWMSENAVETKSAKYTTASPLEFDLEGDGNKLDTTSTIKFDIDGDGILDNINDSLDAVLVFDKDGNGISGEDGSEMFGDNTDLDNKDGRDGYDNGFEALKALRDKAIKEGILKDRGDNKLNSDDLKLLEVAYGLKIKVNGYNSQAQSLSDVGITEINLSNSKVSDKKQFDNFGNEIQTQQGATFKVNGEEREYSDVWHRKYDKEINNISKKETKKEFVNFDSIQKRRGNSEFVTQVMIKCLKSGINVTIYDIYKLLDEKNYTLDEITQKLKEKNK